MVDSLQVFEILKSGNLPDAHARAMTLAIQKAESDVALDVKTVLERQLTAFEERMEARMEARFDAFESRVEARFVAFESRSEVRFAAFAANVESRFAAFETKTAAQFKAVDTRFDAVEARFDHNLTVSVEKMNTKLAETKTEILRWNFAFWVAQLAAVAGLFKLMK